MHYSEMPLPIYPVKNNRKQCAACLEEKDLKEYYSKPERHDGRSRYCRVCSHNPGTRYVHKALSGSAGYYENKANEQKDRCAICDKHKSQVKSLRSGRLYLDHSHVTHRARGLLCHGCNVSLGYAERKGVFTDNQKKYLDKYS